MYLDLGRWIRICMVLEWTLGLPTVLQDRSSLLQCQSTSQGNMGDSEPPGICACIIHTNLQSCMSIISETLHDHHMHMREPHGFQATRYWVPEDQGTGVSVRNSQINHFLLHSVVSSRNTGIVIRTLVTK